MKPISIVAHCGQCYWAMFVHRDGLLRCGNAHCKQYGDAHDAMPNLRQPPAIEPDSPKAA